MSYSDLRGPEANRQRLAVRAPHLRVQDLQEEGLEVHRQQEALGGDALLGGPAKEDQGTNGTEADRREEVEVLIFSCT